MKLEAYNGQFLTYWGTSVVPVDSLTDRSIRKCYRLHVIGAVTRTSTRDNITFLKSNLCDVESISSSEEDPNFIPKYEKLNNLIETGTTCEDFEDADEHILKQGPLFWQKARQHKELVRTFPYLKMFFHYPQDVPLNKNSRLSEEKKVPWLIRLDIIDSDGKVRSVNFFTNFETLYNNSRALKPYVDRHIKFNMEKITT
ncbi:unnamed protein product [Auanema sp. JU1783]|nr:unnamed protein product [Auanema sp. JU1783]